MGRENIKVQHYSCGLSPDENTGEKMGSLADALTGGVTRKSSLANPMPSVIQTATTMPNKNTNYNQKHTIRQKLPRRKYAPNLPGIALLLNLPLLHNVQIQLR
jgi:hypothetical protein